MERWECYCSIFEPRIVSCRSWNLVEFERKEDGMRLRTYGSLKLKAQTTIALECIDIWILHTIKIDIEKRKFSVIMSREVMIWYFINWICSTRVWWTENSGYRRWTLVRRDINPWRRWMTTQCKHESWREHPSRWDVYCSQDCVNMASSRGESEEEKCGWEFGEEKCDDIENVGCICRLLMRKKIRPTRANWSFGGSTFYLGN